jgi:hypothetical protein
VSASTKVVRTITADIITCDHPKCDATVEAEVVHGDVVASARQLATEVFAWVHIEITGGRSHVEFDLCPEHAVDNFPASWLTGEIASASAARR